MGKKLKKTDKIHHVNFIFKCIIKGCKLALSINSSKPKTDNMKTITEKSLQKVLLLALFPVFLFSCGQSSQNENFLSEIGICTSVDNHAKMNEHGYTFIEEGLLRFLKPLEPHESFLPNFEKAQNAEIPVYATNLFLPGHLKAVGEEPMHDQIIAYADTAFRRAEMIGIKRVVFGSSGSRRIPEGFDRDLARGQFIDLLKKLGPVAQKYDVVIIIEPLNSREVNFINTSLEGLSIVKETNHPNIQLLVDIFHMMRENEPPSNILEAEGYIKHVHVAEFENRTAPGTAGDDFTPYLKALLDIDYQGAISIEGRWDDFDAQLPVAIATLKEQIQRVKEM